jgi:hypothetical protein
MEEQWLVDWAFAVSNQLEKYVTARFPRDLASWPCVATFNAKAFLFEERKCALIVLEPKASGLPDIGGLETTDVVEAPLIPTDVWSALRQQSTILQELRLNPRCAVLVIPFDKQKITLRLSDYFNSWSKDEKDSWARQMEANFLRQQQALLGFPRLEHAPFVPPGYEYLMEPLSLLLKDHSSYEQNIFIMTRLAEHSGLNQAIASIVGWLKENGCAGLKANDKTYYVGDRVLWNNVCTYMIGCSKGIAILEDIVKSDFNPNIALEYGFMRALNKPVLILADRRFDKISADVMGILYERFDLMRPETAKPAISNWLGEITRRH